MSMPKPIPTHPPMGNPAMGVSAIFFLFLTFFLSLL